MTTTEAALVIGCTAAHVRRLCKSGTIRAKRKKSGPAGMYYDLNIRDVEQYRDTTQTVGFPRGRSRRVFNL